jgi:hypothetical protein
MLPVLGGLVEFERELIRTRHLLILPRLKA